MKFKIQKRKFLMFFLGALGSLPFLNFFSLGRYISGRYYLYATMTIKNQKKSYHYDDMPIKQSKFDALDAKMFHQKKLLKSYTVHANKTKKWIWLYIFDSKKSFLEWENEVEKNRLFPTSFLPQGLQYFRKTGFFI